MKISDMKTCIPLLLLSTGALHAQPPATDVPKTIMERSGKQLRLGDDGETDGGTRDAVHGLLRHSLTADDAAQVALLNNRSLRATLEEIGVSQADLREAGLMKNPRFDLTVRFPDRPPTGTDAEEAVAFDFLDLLMIPLRRRVAAAQLDQTRLRVANAVLELAATTKIAFYELQAQMQLVKRMKLILETNQAAIELAQEQYKAGNITDLALASQQAAYSQSRLEVAVAEAAILEKREKLNRAMGLWGADTGWKAAGQLPEIAPRDFSMKNLESLAMEQRPDLAAARAELAGVVQALGLTRSYRFIGAMEFGIDTEHNPDHSNVTGPTMQLELPLFNQGQARIAKANARLRQAEDRFEAMAIDIRSEVREARDRLIARRDAAVFYRDELLPGRMHILSLTQVQYNAMLAGTFDLLLAKQNELDAERGYVEASRDYWIARAQLERAVGGNLDRKRDAQALGGADSSATDSKTMKSSTRHSH